MKRTGKSLALALCLLLLLSCLPLPAVFAADPVAIATADEFIAFTNGDAAASAVLTADIDLGEWTTAFTDGFSGTLDGNGHSVTYTKTNPAGNFHSLIKLLNEGGVIKNLTVKGQMTFTAARTYNAPFVYENHGTIENCVNEMTITHTGTKNCQYNAGITAKNFGLVKNCVNNGDISVRNYAGGIVAQNLGGTVSGCVNNGSVTATNVAGYAGGIVAAIGAARSADVNLIEACTNNGAVTGGSGGNGFAGGIVGQINIASSYATYDSRPVVTISGCSSTGMLSAGGGTDEFVAKNNNPDNSTLTIEAGTPAHEHTYGEGVETTPAKCNEDGVMTYTCTGCDEGTEGHTKTAPIPATGVHTPGEWTEETLDGEAMLVKRCTVCGTVTAKKSAEAAKTLENAVAALRDGWFRLQPVFGRDTNVCDMVTEKLASLGYEGISVALASAETPADGAAAIEEDGDIRYFYADPAVWRAMYFASVPVTFTLTMADADAAYENAAVIRWDAEKAAEAMETQIAARVTEEVLRGENESLEAVTTDLVLPKAVLDDAGERALWTLISWESSNEAVISVDNSAQSSADTLFNPYRGVVKRGIEDQTVMLTAVYTFQKTAYDEAPITLEKTYPVTVKGMGNELLTEMQRQLDENYLAEKLTYIGSKAPVDPAAVTDDVQLLLPRTSGVENPADYTFAVASDSPNAQVNAARLNILRPLPGEAPAAVTLTVTMAHRSYDLAVQKEIALTVAPITEEELAAHRALMEQVKASLFEGVNNGANASPEQVTENLSPFIEAVADGSGGILWVRNIREATDAGIAAVSIDLSHPSEQWDRFYSSDPAVLSHETLLVNRQKENAAVALTVCLSDSHFARYAELYPENEAFAGLSRQTVTLELIVPGTDPTPETPAEPGADPAAQDEAGVCALCGKQHTGFFGRLVKIFHDLVLFFRSLGSNAGC